jgi:hypothetical protein
MVQPRWGTKQTHGRGEAARAIFEYIRKHPNVPKGELEEVFNHSTVWYTIYRDGGALKDKIHIIKKSMPKGKKIDTYIVKEEKSDRPNKDYIDFLMKEFIEHERKLSDFSQNKKLKYVINEMEHLCFNKKIRDETFINFLISKTCDKFYLTVDSSYRTWNCLQILTQNLNQDIRKKGMQETGAEQGLLDKIRSSCIDYLEEVVFDEDVILHVRVDALDTIAGIDFEYSFNVAVQLLRKLDTQRPLVLAPWDTRQMTEYTAFIALIGYILWSYAQDNEKNWVECRKALFHLLDPNGDIIKKSEIQKLWEVTALGSKIPSVTITPRKPSELDKI